MEISKVFDEKELILSVKGRIDTTNSQNLENEINGEFGNFNSLVIDAADLEYISSAGLRVFIITQKKLKADNTPFVIKNVNDTVGEIFKMSGLDKIMKIE